MESDTRGLCPSQRAFDDLYDRLIERTWDWKSPSLRDGFSRRLDVAMIFYRELEFGDALSLLIALEEWVREQQLTG